MLRRLLFKNFKLFYRLNQFLKYRFTQHGLMMLIIMITAGIFGIDTRSTLSFQLFSIAFLLLCTAFILSLLQRKQYEIKRILPDTGMVGELLEYRCIINNNSKQTIQNLIIIDELYSEFPDFSYFAKSSDPLDKKRFRFDRIVGYPRLINLLRYKRGGSIPSVNVDYIASHHSIEEKIRFKPLRRGYVYLNKIMLARSEPLGLFQSIKSFSQKDKILILPKLYQLPELDMIGHRMYLSGNRQQVSKKGDTQEFVSLREYRPGDPLRAIHWRSYARLGKPVVKEYQDEYQVRYGLILDTFLSPGNTIPVFEEAVSIAASFVASHKQQDSLLDLMFIGNRAYRYTSGKGHHQTQSILEILACAESNSENNLSDLFALLNSHINECCGLICVLLAFDIERQTFLKQLDQLGMQATAFIVTDEQSADINIQFQHISSVFIPTDNVQITLDQLKQAQKVAA